MTRLLILLICLPLISSAQFEYKKFGINEEKGVPDGLKIGAKAPKFVAYDAFGEKIKLKDILKEESVVLVFYRGQWCPVCNDYLRNLNDSLSHIKAKGARLIAVGPESQENALKSSGQSGGDFTFIVDSYAEIMRAYDVLFSVTEDYQSLIVTHLNTSIQENNNSEEALLPVPATYIIGKDGRIKYKHFNLNYYKRASVKEMLEHL